MININIYSIEDYIKNTQENWLYLLMSGFPQWIECGTLCCWSCCISWTHCHFRCKLMPQTSKCRVAFQRLFIWWLFELWYCYFPHVSYQRWHIISKNHAPGALQYAVNHYKERSATEETVASLQRHDIMCVNTTSSQNLNFVVRHNFVAKYEDEQFKPCLRTSLANTMVLIVDYVESYFFEIQTKV